MLLGHGFYSLYMVFSLLHKHENIHNKGEFLMKNIFEKNKGEFLMKILLEILHNNMDKHTHTKNTHIITKYTNNNNNKKWISIIQPSSNLIKLNH